MPIELFADNDPLVVAWQDSCPIPVIPWDIILPLLSNGASLVMTSSRANPERAGTGTSFIDDIEGGID